MLNVKPVMALELLRGQSLKPAPPATAMEKFMPDKAFSQLSAPALIAMD